MNLKWLNAAVIFALLLVAGATHGPVFGSARGYLAVLGGVLIGGSVALISATLRWGWLLTSMMAALAYLLLGGAFAVPELNIAVVVPTLQSLQLLVMQVVYGWRDSLTVSPPLYPFTGPAVLPLFSAMVCSLIAVTLAVRTTRRTATALIPVGVLGVTGILWGSQRAPYAIAIAAVGVVGALLWASWLASSRRRQSSSGILATEGHRPGPRRLGAVLSVLVAVAVALGLAWLVPTGHRNVLRDHVEPPLKTEEYHSPLSYFRHYVANQKEESLFTVQNLPPGYRVRVATMDAYDGTVYRVSSTNPEQAFRRVGNVTSEDTTAPERALTLDVQINAYTGHWVPGSGQVHKIDFTSERAKELASSLYYSHGHGALFSKAPLAKGDSYQVSVVPDRGWSDEELARQTFAAVPMPADEFVPDVVAQMATELTSKASSPIEQIRAIEQHLHKEGFFSNGDDNLSRSGHRAERIRTLLTDTQMIGDDEQYAVAMALMVRQLGIPARVVLGFYPEDAKQGKVSLTGNDVHAWVEVAFSAAGWVPFNPTPPREQKPQTQIPKPKVQPKPQVLQPPPPPVEPAELPPEFLDEDNDSDEQADQRWLAYLLIGAQILGGVLLVLSPFLTVLIVKAVRRRRRRTRGDEIAKAAGAWQEVVDQARDLRHEFPPQTVTRREQAAVLDQALGETTADDPDGLGFRLASTGSASVLADAVDRSVFSSELPALGTADQAWSGADEMRRRLRGTVGRFRRLAASVSLHSLRRPRQIVTVSDRGKEATHG